MNLILNKEDNFDFYVFSLTLCVKSRSVYIYVTLNMLVKLMGLVGGEQHFCGR